MKKIILSAAAVSALMANQAMAEVDVYGKINLSLNKVDIENKSDPSKDVDNLQLVSHASRLGFKGDTEITPELKALAKIEYDSTLSNGRGIYHVN